MTHGENRRKPCRLCRSGAIDGSRMDEADGTAAGHPEDRSGLVGREEETKKSQIHRDGLQQTINKGTKTGKINAGSPRPSPAEQHRWRCAVYETAFDKRSCILLLATECRIREKTRCPPTREEGSFHTVRESAGRQTARARG
jgi:hypothetical protein